MSLINDALKRAKEAQQQTPAAPAPGPQFRPVESTPQVRRGLGLALPFALGVTALLGLFLAWEVAQNRSRTSLAPAPTQTAAATATIPSAPDTAPAATAPLPAVQPQPAPASPAPAAVPAQPNPAAPPRISTTEPASNAVASAAIASLTIAAPASQGLTSTNTSATTNAPPKPAPLKLQAIVFNPTRPSVMIGGKTLFVGDRIGELRVVAIGRDSATLAGSGETKVLNLSE